MRQTIIDVFPTSPGLPTDTDAYMQRVEEIYLADAYHSLSIEGYRVSARLIEKVRSDTWKPDLNEADRERANGLAARGYYDAFQTVAAGGYPWTVIPFERRDDCPLPEVKP